MYRFFKHDLEGGSGIKDSNVYMVPENSIFCEFIKQSQFMKTAYPKHDFDVGLKLQAMAKPKRIELRSYV